MGEWAEEHEARWSGWLRDRNRRGLVSALWITIALYPAFGVLDYLTAPHERLPLLLATRAAVAALTLAMFRIVKSSLFERHPDGISAAFMVLISFGISSMTVFLGGLASPYYAGLSLTIVATGLLYVWPFRVVVVTHATIIASYVLPNLVVHGASELAAAISNQFFLVSTAIIVGTGQFLTYRAQRAMVHDRLVIERTKKSLEQAHDDLKQLDRFKSEFFANITHELKTPLTMMLAPLELMIDGQLGGLSEAQRSTLSSVQKSGIKLRRLIGDLLDLSKLEESKLRLRIGEHDLVAYIRDLVALAEPLTQRKALELSFRSSLDSCKVWCDLERIERVIVNLLSNATKFTPPHGKVRVELSDEGDAARIDVSDTGIGFPQGMAERIFDRFFQLDMADTRRYGGAGIGLALAKELVELHGGSIWARGEPGGGATLSVRLFKDREHFRPDALDRRAQRSPYQFGSRRSDHGVAEWHTDDEERFRLIEIDQATEQRVVERDPDEQLRPYSVLVVEDTPDVIRVIRLALHHEFRILAASNGNKGLELAKKHRPTIIVTDLMMPELDGLSLTRELRADPTTRHTPIVMLTARGDVEDRVAGHDMGVNAYLAKPFSAKELVAVVRGQLRGQETTADLLMHNKLDSLKTLAGGLAHEIRNPLNYVKSAVEAIRRDGDKLMRVSRDPVLDSAREIDLILPRMQRMFETADSGIRRIAATVELMMRYSREGYTRAPQPYDAYKAIQDVLAMLRPSVNFELTLGTELCGDGMISCVPEEFNQMVTNLVENALHAVASDGTGRITVSGENRAGWLVLTIRDNGAGIAPEDQPKIFTAFFTTKDVARGTGLGLTIVHRVVDVLGGTVQVQSEVGSGTEFTVRLPSLGATRAPLASSRSAREEVRE